MAPPLIKISNSLLATGLDPDALEESSRPRVPRWMLLAVATAVAVVVILAVLDARHIRHIHEVRERQEEAFRAFLSHAGSTTRRTSAMEPLDDLNREADVARDEALRSNWITSGLIIVLFAGIAGLSYRSYVRRHLAEEIGRRQNRRFRALIEHSHDVVGTLSPGGITTWVSPSVEGVLGWHPEEMIGRNGFDLVHPDDVPRLAPTLMTLPPDGTARAEFRFRHKNGTWIWVEGQVVNRIADPAVGGIVTNYREITERKAAQDALSRQEERFRMMIENAQEIIAVLDATGAARFGSRSMQAVLGWNPADLPGRATFDLVHPEDRAALDRAMAELMATPGAVRTLACRMRHQDGSWRFMEGTGKNLLEDPAVHGVVLWYRDVTDRVAGEAALRSSEAALREAQKMEAIGRLAGGVAHDFNNLLTVINGYSELALDRLPAADPSRGRLEEILKAGRRAAELTQQLLAFSRRQTARIESVDMNALLGDTEKLLRRLVGEDVAIVTRAGDGLGPVLADPAQMQQVIINLAVNARDAMPRGGTLTLATAGIGTGAERKIRLTATDTGTGMPPEVLARIFEPFFTTKETGKGTGLGLSIVYGNVKAAGGTIAVESTPGAGTVFTVELPVAAAAPVPGDRQVPAAAPERGTETVLLVEDQPDVRALAREILEGHGYSVLEAGDGDAAVALVRQRTDALDLVVSDVVMPGMPSADMAAAIRELRPAARWLFMSGYSEHAAIHPLLLSGAVPFLEKPFAPAGLARKVREVLDMPVVPPPPA